VADDDDSVYSYRVLADENIEPPTVRQLQKLGHYVERVVDALGTGVSDGRVAEPAEEENRLVLTDEVRLEYVSRNWL
jgi:hypothetical protein